MIAAALLLAAQAAELPEYPVSIRCAALAETAHAGANKARDAARTRTYYDALVFWGLAASERARKDGLTAKTFSEDQLKARKVSDADRAGSEARFSDELAGCLAKVPNLK